MKPPVGRLFLGRGILLCLLFVMGIPAATAATYYVRSDGGNASQCTGRSNSPYPGSGTNQACAWRHPFVALPPGSSPRIQGGDTLHIGPGNYRMGYGAPNTGNCTANGSGSCHMPPIPSGPSSSQPTRILGAGHAQGCTQPPELWGAEGASMVINMRGSSNVEMACLEITDRGSCVLLHCNSGQCGGEVAACKRSSPPLGNWASTGLSARDSTSVQLRDLNIHGMANQGVHAGRISNWTMLRVKINANGWAGWSGNIGDTTSSNSGTIIFRESEIAWNGCGERWPGGEIFGCWGQIGGGWGDGLGTARTGGHWIFEDSAVHHNTSDGIDLLYMNDSARATIRRTLVKNNAGNQIKVSRAATIENSVVVGNCSYFRNHPNMLAGDQCRAQGDAVFVGLSNSSQTDLINNTIVGEGNCVISGGGGSSASRLRMVNNLILGKPYFFDTSKQSCLYYSGGSEQIVWDRNFIRGVRNNACPGNSLCGGSPGIADERLGSFNAEPTSGSALIARANSSFAPPVDFWRLPRGAGGGPDIGAIEYGVLVNDQVFGDAFSWAPWFIQ